MSGLLQNVKLIGDGQAWLRELRSAGQAAFAKNGIPTAKTEAWKYTKPNRFLSSEFFVEPKGTNELPLTTVDVPFEAYKIYFNDGVFNPALSEMPENIEILPLIEAVMFQHELRDKIGALVDMDKYPFAAFNTAGLNEGLYIHIPEGCALNKPVMLINHVTVQEQNRLYNLRNLLVVDDNASAEFVEYYCYEGIEKSSYLVNVVNEIFIGRNALLKHYKIQNEAFKAGHLALNSVNVAQSGCYKSFCYSKGADLARNETKVILAEEGASAEVDAAYMMNGWATLDTTTDIEHLKPYTQSSQLVKGVVGGKAKGVFQGKIHIAPNAVKTEGYQLHKAMLLTDEAEIDVKPELEIFADDVKCSHGAACGQLDAEQLFYMRSRGIGEAEARQLLIDAYLNDVIAKVDDGKIAAWIKLSVKDTFTA